MSCTLIVENGPSEIQCRMVRYGLIGEDVGVRDQTRENCAEQKKDDIRVK